MKKGFLIFLGASAGFALAWFAASQRAENGFRLERAQWQAEKATLETALEEAKNHKPLEMPAIEKKEVVRVHERVSPEDIIHNLQQIRIGNGPGQNRNTRLIIQQLENLIAIGTPALPAIRDFLIRNEEIDYDSPFGQRGSREGKISTEFTVPPSLRFGLLDAARQIGGPESEKLLAEVLTATGRGVELAYLARVLQEMAPFKYREVCVNSARELLARPLAPGAPGLDKYDREYLYGVLALFGDTSFASVAQSQLVRADGGVDRGALKYLQQTVGPQALPSVLQAYQDPTVEGERKEPLARYALAFTGADAQATDLWHKSINDPALSMDQRRELIEDLNQDGFQNEKTPTETDAQLIKNRLALIDKFSSEHDNPILQDAWKEAQKDLQKMLADYISGSALKP